MRAINKFTLINMKSVDILHISVKIQPSFMMGDVMAKKWHGGRKVIDQLSESQNHRCAYCGRQTWHRLDECKGNEWHQATVDHLISRGDGGGNHWTNMIMACYECNNRRSDMDAMYFFKIVNGIDLFEKI